MRDIIPAKSSELAMKVAQSYQKMLAYLNEKKAIGIVWEVRDAGAAHLTRRLDYITHAQTHYRVIAPELRRLTNKAGFSNRYEFYALDAHASAELDVYLTGQFTVRRLGIPSHWNEDRPLYHNKQFKLTPRQRMWVRLVVWPQ